MRGVDACLPGAAIAIAVLTIGVPHYEPVLRMALEWEAVSKGLKSLSDGIAELISRTGAGLGNLGKGYNPKNEPVPAPPLQWRTR